MAAVEYFQHPPYQVRYIELFLLALKTVLVSLGNFLLRKSGMVIKMEQLRIAPLVHILLYWPNLI